MRWKSIGYASLFSTLLSPPSSEPNLLINAIILALSFAIILVGSELFTNGVEWAGHRLHIAEAAVGSVLAAVGTALPETFIPAVALLTGRDSAAAHTAVGLGAIVGAPLMLSTVALFVMGIAATRISPAPRTNRAAEWCARTRAATSHSFSRFFCCW